MKNHDFDDLIKEIENAENNLTWYDNLEIFIYRMFREPIHFFKYDLWEGLRNFWRYKKVIWRHRWWDYTFADDVIGEMYKERAENWHMSHHVKGDKEERELKIIVELFKRLEDSEYLVVQDDPEDKIRKEIYRLIARKRYWD